MPEGDEPEVLYHVTYWSRLERIAEHGLERGRGRAIGGPAYDTHARRGVFLTELDGVYSWHARAEDHAENGSDNVLEDGLVPVVLRMPRAAAGELEPDDVGSEDAQAEAFIAHGPIKASALEVYDGKEWVDVANWERVDPADGVEEDEEDGETLYFFPVDSPLIPPEARLP